MAIINLLKHHQRRISTAIPALANPNPNFSPFLQPCRLFSATQTVPSEAPSLLQKHGARTVGIFWDMDNKPPLPLPPVKAARRLESMAARFGSIVDVVVYTSKLSLKKLPSWSQELRRYHMLAEEQRAKGLAVAKKEEAYLCQYCGRRYRNNYALQKHFANLHEKEHERRLVQLSTMKKRGKRNCLIRSQLEKRETRYKEISRIIAVPDKGYGLAAELQRTGMPVIQVSNKPQRAAIALQKHMIQFVEQGINCLWLVSHDTRFLEVLEMARERQLHIIVLTENPKLRKCADICFSWEDLGSRLAMADADDIASQWLLEDSVRGSPHSNFLTTELNKIPPREDVTVTHTLSAAYQDDKVDTGSDQVLSASESISDFSNDASNFSDEDPDFSSETPKNGVFDQWSDVDSSDSE